MAADQKSDNDRSTSEEEKAVIEFPTEFFQDCFRVARASTDYELQNTINIREHFFYSA